MSAATAGRTAPSRKQVTHERIVGAAARAIRRSGYDGTGVADIMQKVGLTHGGFYAHFASREAMLAEAADRDRKSTRLNSSHRCISYAVFCLKKKKKNKSRNTIDIIIKSERKDVDT